MRPKKEYTKEYLEENVVGKIRGITIPVNTTITPRQRIFEFEELTRIIGSATVLAQTECACRTRMGNCDNPKEGCIALDEYARTWIGNGTGHEVSREDALEALKRGGEHGLVHVAYVRERGKAEVLCTCCECCCDSLAALLRFGYSDQVVESRMIAVQEDGPCTDCGDCAAACHFRARSMVDGKLRFDEGRCAGCGICVHSCSAGAITMGARQTGGADVPFP